ncbi:MAG: glycerol-3-phosphate dehydrogenase [Thermoleophilia bacterium]|nr:glycerol-3-phosphate dehydrogenase [Thermoleophilia bacterium]
MAHEPLPDRPPVTFAASGRIDQLERMAAGQLDVLVVGGGITGVGVALDAVARGLRVGIVEANDWASGTSSRSSKMIHGGLRYLATGHVGVVRESLRERVALQRNAAHLVRPLPMLVPVYGPAGGIAQRARLGAGLWAYDLLGHRAAAGSVHKWRGLDRVTRAVPGIAAVAEAAGGELRGGYAYHDGSADDVRLVLAVLRSAVQRGAFASNDAPVLRLLKTDGRVRGVVVGGELAAAAVGSRDGELEIEAKVVVNATGVWADALLDDADDDGFDVVPSKGIHLMVRRDRAGIDSGVAFFEQTGNSNVFLEPWQDDLCIIGTTDVPHAGPLADPVATPEEVRGMLEMVNQFLRTPLTEADVLASWAGLRPLVRPRVTKRSSKDISRRHLLLDRPGVVTITGGKLTAYRSMAEAAVDAVCGQLGSRVRSTTLELALDGCRELATPSEIGDVAEALGTDRRGARHLLRRHGSNVQHLVALVGEHPELGERLHPDRPYLAVEAAWATRYEQARNADDVLARRTRLTLETADPEVAEDAVTGILAQFGSAAAHDVVAP